MLDKTFDPKSIEEKHYKDWEKSGIFSCDPESSKKPYTIMMPPPNVTGSLHMGHALNTTLQDVLTRYHRMKGYDVLWQPGTDHAGIATQMVVERQLEEQQIVRERDLTRDQFLEKVWEWKEKSGGTIVNQMRALGATPDWERERFTMDEGLSKAVLKVFVQLYKEGLIYKDKRLVNWDTKLLTGVSDLEVEHREVKGKFYHFRYPYEDGTGYVAIATTRPETILADGAVAVHPDDEKYKDLIGRNVIVPVINRVIPVIADEHVQADFGSGAVKITAAHDFNDFEIYKRHPDAGIPVINLFTPDGKMNENCPEDYQGLDRFEARKKVVADFEELELLDKIEDHVNKIPYGDRSGTVIEPYLTEQWYVDAETLAKPAIEAVESGKTEFVPKQWENTYYAWMRDIQPWCISRQLWWGHQIPAWYGPNDIVIVAETDEQALLEVETNYPGSWKVVDKETALKYNFIDTDGGSLLYRDEDVLDTWFSSALWPFSTLGWPEKTSELEKYYQTDVLLTGFDIIFFWVARMMMMGIHFMGEVPFKTVYMHALVRDSKGDKMSKSKGNVMDPIDLIDKYGADALRFTMVSMAAQGRDIRLADERLQGYRNFATKLWNAARYCEMNECLSHEGFDPTTAQHAPNQWIVHELISAQAEIEKAIESYRFNEAANAAYQFVWGTFCDWYLEISKPLLQDGADEGAADEVRKTTSWALEQILILLNPFMPFITEEIYAEFFKKGVDDRLITAKWPQHKENQSYDYAKEKMEWLKIIISEIRSVRADMNVPAGAKIDLLVKDACEETKEGFRCYEDVLKRMARLNSIAHVDEVPRGSVQTIVGQTILILPIADIIDLDAEKARLIKAIGKLDIDIQKVDAKLGNEKFINNAPKEVIAEQKSRKEEALAKREKFAKALKQLGNDSDPEDG